MFQVHARLLPDRQLVLRVSGPGRGGAVIGAPGHGPGSGHHSDRGARAEEGAAPGQLGRTESRDSGLSLARVDGPPATAVHPVRVQ